MVGIGTIHRDSRNTTIGKLGLTIRALPGMAGIGGFVDADTGVRIATEIALAGAEIKRRLVQCMRTRCAGNTADGE